MTETWTIAQLRAAKKKKPAKYSNEKSQVGGIFFDSKKEAKRYQELLLMKRAGLIRELQLQQSFPLKVNDILVCTYRSDFCYIDEKENRLVVEDSKGFRTKDYRIKAKLFKACYGFSILET